MANINEGKTWCVQTFISNDKESAERFRAMGLQPLKNKSSIEQILRRPEVQWNMLASLCDIDTPSYSDEVIEQIVTDIKYAGYLQREEARVAQSKIIAHIKVTSEMNFFLPGISTEVAERLTKASRPIWPVPLDYQVSHQLLLMRW